MKAAARQRAAPAPAAPAPAPAPAPTQRLLPAGCLALPEGLEYTGHDLPRRALQGLAELLHSHASADFRGQQHAGMVSHMEVSAQNMACLIDCIQSQLFTTGDLPRV